MPIGNPSPLAELARRMRGISPELGHMFDSERWGMGGPAPAPIPASPEQQIGLGLFDANNQIGAQNRQGVGDFFGEIGEGLMGPGRWDNPMAGSPIAPSPEQQIGLDLFDGNNRIGAANRQQTMDAMGSLGQTSATEALAGAARGMKPRSFADILGPVTVTPSKSEFGDYRNEPLDPMSQQHMDFKPSGLDMGQEHMEYDAPPMDMGREHQDYRPGYMPTLSEMNPELQKSRQRMDAMLAEGYIEQNSPTDNLGKIQGIVNRSKARSDSLRDPRLGRPELDSSYADDPKGLRSAGENALLSDDMASDSIQRDRMMKRALQANRAPTSTAEMNDSELNSTVDRYKKGAVVVDGKMGKRGSGKDIAYGGIGMGADENGQTYRERRLAEVAKRHKDAGAMRQGMLTDDEMAGLGPDSGIVNVPGGRGQIGAQVMMSKNARDAKLREQEIVAKGDGGESQLKAAELYAALLAMEKKGDLEPGTAAKIAGVAGLKLAPGETPTPQLPGEKATGGAPRDVAGPVPTGSPEDDAFYSPQFSFFDGFLQGIPRRLDSLLNGDPADRGVYGYDAQLRAQQEAERIRRKMGG